MCLKKANLDKARIPWAQAFQCPEKHRFRVACNQKDTSFKKKINLENKICQVTSKMVRILKVGLAGCGRIASAAHLPCYQMMPNAKVVSVMDVVKERAQSTARAFHVKKWYSNYEEMLKDNEVEAVDICSPPHMHAEQAIEAAKSGKHILCEKPISTNLDDALRLQSEIRKAEVMFMTGFTYRFHPLLQKAREEVTTPKLLRVSYSFRPTVASDHWVYDSKKSGGFIVEQAVHWFDLFQWFSGKAKSVYAKGQVNPPSQNIVALISYENDALGLINCNTDSPLSFFILTIENAEKSAMLRIGLLPTKWGGLLQISDRSRKQHSYFLNSWSNNKTWKRASFPVSFIMSKIQDSHLIPFYKEIQHFVHSILDNSPPQVSLNDGIDSLKVAIATKESIRQGKEIYLQH
jgi:predicted dehydrogenase